MTAVSIAWWWLARGLAVWLIAGLTVALAVGWVIRRYPAPDPVDEHPEARALRALAVPRGEPHGR